MTTLLLLKNNLGVRGWLGSIGSSSAHILFFCSNRPAPDRNRGLPARLADPWWLIHGTIRGVSPRHAAAPPGADCQPVLANFPSAEGGWFAPWG